MHRYLVFTGDSPCLEGIELYFHKDFENLQEAIEYIKTIQIRSWVNVFDKENDKIVYEDTD